MQLTEEQERTADLRRRCERATEEGELAKLQLATTINEAEGRATRTTDVSAHFTAILIITSF